MVVDVLVPLTEVGGPEGAAENKTQHMEDSHWRDYFTSFTCPYNKYCSFNMIIISPASRVSAVTVLLTALLLAALRAVTVML